MNADNDNIRVVIIEDELHNSRMLEGIVRKLRPSWTIEAILESVEDSVYWLRNNPPPDLILMDIQLSDGSCFSIFKHVELDSSCRIIFTTAYDEYAIRAFKVNSIDYLLKPINEQELDQSFQKFERLRAAQIPQPYLAAGDKNYYTNLVNSILAGKKEYRTRLLISTFKGYEKLETKDIAYIYSDNKLTFAVDFNRKRYALDYNLEKLESELDPAAFFRASRKAIVNIDAVAKVTNDVGGKLKVETSPAADFEIVVSRLRAGEFKIWMGK